MRLPYLLALCLVVGCTGKHRDAADDSRLVAIKFVTDALKAPATARFAPTEEWSSESIDATTTRWHGWVDSENEFSALLRQRFTVIVSKDPGEWKLRYLKFNESPDELGEYLLTPAEQEAEVAKTKAEWDTMTANAKHASQERERTEAKRQADETAARQKMREQLDDVRRQAEEQDRKKKEQAIAK